MKKDTKASFTPTIGSNKAQWKDGLEPVSQIPTKSNIDLGRDEKK